MPDCQYYDFNMAAYLTTRNSIDVSDYTNLTVEYSIYYDTEPQDDYFVIYSSQDGEYWTMHDVWGGFSAGWTYQSFTISDRALLYLSFEFYSSLASFEEEGVYLDDIQVLGDPGARPNFTDGIPPGWAGPIVPSSVQGTHAVNTLYTNQPTYIDFAIRNTGHSTTNIFFTDLYIDGNIWIDDFFTFGLDSNQWILLEDIPWTVTSPGIHGLKIEIDPLNWVDEADENDNVIVSNFTWVNPPTVPNLTHTIPAFWSGPIIPSGLLGTHYVSDLYSNQPTYMDWAIINNGTGSAGAFSTRLLIDGIQVQSVPIPSLAAGAIYKSEDFMRTLTAGNHVLRLEVDYLNQVVESNPNDNNIPLTFYWDQANITAEGEVLYHPNPLLSGLSTEAKGFRVELWDADSPGSGQLLGTDTTDQFGYFRIGPTINDEGGGDRQDIYIRVYAENYAADVGATYQNTFPYAINTFYFNSDTVQNVTSGVYNWRYPYGPPLVANPVVSGFFYIADVIKESYNDWLSLRQADNPGITKVLLHADSGTFYRYSRDLIYINPDSAGIFPDTFDKDVILHEFGHRLEHAFNFFDTSEGGPHTPTSIKSLGFAASEGFGHLWSSKSRNDSYQRSSYNNFQDTFWINFENGQWGIFGNNDTVGTANTLGKRNEIAVGGMLWDIFDNNSDDFSGKVDWGDTLLPHHPDNIKDTLTQPADSILGILFKNTTTGHKPDNINDFWESWFLPLSQSHVRAMLNIWYEHGDSLLISIGIRGDVNGDGIDCNILDMTYLIDRINRGGPPSPRPVEADVNADGITSTILDLTYIIDRIYRGGPPPPSCP